ncbi:MAG: hypothetical protein HYV07_13845 [Deltaproteobacteria bacterium]|nr:hypothetical protein [Deltaproteobacteria bacterium]
MSTIGSRDPRANGPREARLRLDDVLDALHRPEGRQLVDEVKASLAEAGVRFDGPVVMVGKPTDQKRVLRPIDDFEVMVSKALTTNAPRRVQGQTAIPNAMVSALVEASREDGTISIADVEKVWGKRASSITTRIAELLDYGKKDLPTTRRRSKYRWLPASDLERIAKSAPAENLKKRMPLLGEVSRMFGAPTKLAGLRMATVQHLFPTTSPLFEELSKNGLDRALTVIHGKNYSTNEDTFFRMKAAGWNVPGFAMMSVSGRDGKAMNVAGQYLWDQLRDLDPKDSGKPPKLLILDEGGKLLKALHEDFPEYAHLCVAVEQTDHGIQVIEAMKQAGIELKCPVVSVARSGAKKIAESPMIGESVVHGIETALEALSPVLAIEPREAVVIGYGAVGKASADALKRRGFKVFVYDTDPAKMEQAKAEGCTVGGREQILAHGHLLISATGRTTIVPDELDKLLPNQAVLVNAGSGNHELGMDGFVDGPGFKTGDPKETLDEDGWRRSEFKGKQVVLGDVAGLEQTFSRVLRTESGNERLVLRSGYVVNMVDDIPPEFIQLTRALLLAGCLQAVDHAGQNGVVDLDPRAQDFIVKRAAKHLADKKLSLTAPDFRRLAPAEQ